jgi:AcrR family transcriptional regulator
MVRNRTERERVGRDRSGGGEASGGDRSGGAPRDLRVEKTLAAIKGAFRELALETDADRISVKAVAERANINRKTFYLHYSCIEDLAEDVLQDLAQSYYVQIDAIEDDMPIDQTNRVFFEWMESQGDLLEHLLVVPSYQDFLRRLFASTMAHNRSRHNAYAHLPASEQAIVNTFLAEATHDMYLRWLLDGKQVPLERMIELSSDLLAHGATPLRDDTTKE